MAYTYKVIDFNQGKRICSESYDCIKDCDNGCRDKQMSIYGCIDEAPSESPYYKNGKQLSWVELFEENRKCCQGTHAI